jgi:hypothetical protein
VRGEGGRKGGGRVRGWDGREKEPLKLRVKWVSETDRDGEDIERIKRLLSLFFYSFFNFLILRV